MLVEYDTQTLGSRSVGTLSADLNVSKYRISAGEALSEDAFRLCLGRVIDDDTLRAVTLGVAFLHAPSRTVDCVSAYD